MKKLYTHILVYCGGARLHGCNSAGAPLKNVPSLGEILCICVYSCAPGAFSEALGDNDWIDNMIDRFERMNESIHRFMDRHFFKFICFVIAFFGAHIMRWFIESGTAAKIVYFINLLGTILL